MRITHTTRAGASWEASAAACFSAANAVKPRAPAAGQPAAFGLPPASAVDLCSVDGGASVNCPSATLTPHGNGTHTECVGHALPGALSLADVRPPPPLMPALLLSVAPVRLDGCGDAYAPGAAGDWVVSAGALAAARAAADAAAAVPPAPAGGDGTAATAAAAAALLADFVLGGALVVRTLPNDDAAGKRTRQWGGSNAPYFTPAAMALALSWGVQHLMCDLPSVDREDDGGQLLAHRAFWGLPPRGAPPAAAAAAPGGSCAPPLCDRTITELAVVPSAAVAEGAPNGAAPVPLPDGPYVLALQVAPIHLDAAPSRPLLFPAALVARPAEAVGAI